MRTAIQLCFVCAMVAVCRGQGYFEFSNFGSAPIFGPDTNDVHLQQWGNPPDAFPPGNQNYTGPRLAGTNYSVDATYSLEPVTDDFELRLDFLQLPLPPKRFSGIFPGFFFGAEVSITGAPNFYVYLQVRAWDNAGGLYPTWTAAWTAAQNGSGKSVGWSQVFGQPLGVSTMGGPYPTLDNFESFNTFIVPEPTMVWLIALGVTFWVFGRRRPQRVRNALMKRHQKGTGT